MRMVRLSAIMICILALFFSGCASIKFSREIKQTNHAIEQARLRGADRNCPDEFQKIVNMRNEAVDIFWECRGFEAMRLAREARERAKALCPSKKDSDGDGVPDDLDQCPGTPIGVEVDERGCPVDSDGDGVPDYKDECPDTPKGVQVDKKGCLMDSDSDGVPDYMDRCPGTPIGVEVDQRGCPLDSDGDTVPNYKDRCPDTPKGVEVDSTGCQLDIDGDGVPDYLDQCPNTPRDVKVDKNGCPLDSDGDGVYDHLDQCPRTPKDAKVDERGCWVLKEITFDTAKWDIEPQFYSNLDKTVAVLKKNPSLKVEIQGHTDNRGTEAYNQRLSENRAKAVLEYFVRKGIKRERLSAVGFGLSKPIASNAAPEGRAKNRRVELKPIP